MKTLDANAVAIALAVRDGKHRVTAEHGRFGDLFAIRDEHGVIGVALDEAQLNARLADARDRAETGRCDRGASRLWEASSYKLPKCKYEKLRQRTRPPLAS